MIIKANTNTDNPTTPGGDVSSRQTHTPRGADTFGFNGIDTSQHTGDLVVPAVSAARQRGETPLKELIGNTVVDQQAVNA